MPQISSNFILRSKLPNFERDSFDTWNDMIAVDSAWMDEGHISYCKEKRKHYVFSSDNGTLTGAARWSEWKLDSSDVETYIDSHIVIPVNTKSDLTNDLAAQLSVGRPVYVKEDHSLYYNIYDNSIPDGYPQTGTYLEGETGWFYPLRPDMSQYVTNDSLTSTLTDYVKTEDLPTIEGGVTQEDLDDYVLKSEYEETKNQTNTNKNAIGEIDDRVSALESSTVSKTEFAEEKAGFDGKYATHREVVVAVQELSESVKDTFVSKTELESVEKSLVSKTELEEHVSDFNAYITEFNEYKEYVEETYAKPEDINDQLTTYYPTIDPESDEPKDKGAVWVGSDEYGELSGKTKTVIGGKYTFNDIFDEILFNRITPAHSEPSISVKLLTSVVEDGIAPWFIANNIEWYNESDRSILVEAYSVTPNSEDFIEDNIVDSYISYPESYISKLEAEGKSDVNKYTDGLRPSATGAPRTIGNCKVFKNGEWVDYSENYGLPTADTLVPGEYHYHIVGYFNGKNIIIDNYNQKIRDVWNSNTPVESSDYITLYVSKPVYYNTLDGMVKKPLKLWNTDLMSDEFTLIPSCQLEQSFMVPRKLKAMYIWNDLLGGYGQVPMVADLSDEGIATNNVIPAYFKESVDENGYYTYKYDAITNGHRGAVKIKVEF